MNKVNYQKQVKISKNFKHVECLNCRQPCRIVYGYIYEPAMDDSHGHHFICRKCWNKTPQWKREWCKWQIFTQELAQEVEKDWSEKEAK